MLAINKSAAVIKVLGEKVPAVIEKIQRVLNPDKMAPTDLKDVLQELAEAPKLLAQLQQVGKPGDQHTEQMKAALDKLSGGYADSVHRDSDFAQEMDAIAEKIGKSLPPPEGGSCAQPLGLHDGPVPPVPDCIGQAFLLRCALVHVGIPVESSSNQIRPANQNSQERPSESEFLIIWIGRWA